MSLKPEDEITSITFDHKGAHMAVCHKAQGYGANGRPEALLIKSDDEAIPDEAISDLEFIKATSEVQIDTTMFTFLRKWMGMYYDDADALARILGYEGDGMEVTEWIEEKIEGITLLEAATLCGEASQYVDEDIAKLNEFIKSFEDLEKDSLSEGDPDVKEEIDKSQIPSENKLEPQGDLMSLTDQEKLEKANQDAIDLAAKVEKLEKAAADAKDREDALTARADKLEKAAQERLEKAFLNKVQTYSFVTEDEAEEFAKTLILLDNEDVVTMLDKAQAALTALGETQGVDTETDVVLEKSSSLQDKIMAKYDLGDKD